MRHSCKTEGLKTQLLRYFIFTTFIWSEATAQLFLGGNCTFGGHSNVKGICKQLADCPSALSNFRAGISPSLCYQENDISVICCQVEGRISGKKCREYSQRLASSQNNEPSFGPLSSEGGFGNSDREESEGADCNKDPNISTFVVGGRNAGKYEMSFTAALGFEDEGGNQVAWKCGASLISEQFVLTCAHCVDSKGKSSSKPTVVLLGDKSLKRQDSFSSQFRVEAKVAEIYVHPDYKRPIKYNDIALIKLDRKINFSRALLPACLPQPEARPETVNEFFVAGWGRLEYFGKRGESLQMAPLKRIGQKECSQTYRSSAELPNGLIKSQLCVGDRLGNRDSCDGDSGGPLATKVDKATCMQTIMGLVSFGDNFCGSGTPAVYTNVQSHLDWIESIVWSDEINYTYD